ncbi:efflux RND transporter permease subunit [Gracilibacillus caseinilyticus]|uniref:Efflux RND transporter permease subunit n=1 Tax=Gracilibacillus caseinilyticus TaxID=2932256 RepID=A0ABY4F0K8_9BACI|nr:efflux RND transporter permease subunit [Gracilibacillus caseinilyticus]UOQ50196.1 efflux RND transporter permease subunit [Gracilibacillus caseinilyticus]
METLLKYRKIVWIFVLLLIITGIFTYLQTPKRDIPEISQNIASISTVYPGANPEVVENEITNPIEEKVMEIEGVDNVTSASTNGFSTVTVTLSDNANSDSVYSTIRQYVQDAESGFPDDAFSPEVKTDLVTSSVATYHLLSDNRDDLYAIRDQVENWKSSLTEISGISSVSVKGLPEQKVLISLDQEALADNQIQPNQVIEAIQNELSPTALGTESNQQQNILLNLVSVDDLAQLEDIYIAGETTLSDIASINVENEATEDLITYKDQAALSLTVFAEDGGNISSLQDQIDEKVSKLKEDLPAEVNADRFYSQSTVIDEVYNSLLISLAISLLSVIIIMVLGLPISSAILVALAIPISIIVGLIPLPYAGVDLNQISIIGIIVAIGILVDDAIVVNDNIMRRYQLGDGPMDGVKRGLKEVRVSIVTSTLLIVFSFFPLTFLSGSNGEFIRALPIALMGTIIASTLLALTLIPTVQYTRQLKLYKTKKRRVGLLTSFFRWLENLYADNVLPAIIKKPWLTVISGIVICILLLLLAVKVPFEFFPAADRAEVTLSLTLDEGTPIEETDQKLADIESYIQENAEDISETARYTGGGLPNIFNSGLTRSGENTGQIVIRVDRDKTSASAFIEQYEKELRDEFPDSEIFLETIVSGPPPSPAIELKLKGPDLDVLLEKSTALKDQLNELDSVEIATVNTGTSQPVKTYDIDRDFLAQNGISLNQVTGTLQLANAGVPLSEIKVDDQKLNMELRLDEGTENAIDLSELSAVVASDQGAPSIYSFDEFITSSEDQQIAAITHTNGDRTITISAYESGEGDFAAETTEVIDSMRAELDDIDGEYALGEDGEASAETEFFVEVAKLFVIVLFLIYITLAIQFNSLLTPFLITSTIFLAITGAVVGLFVSGQPLSFLAVLGIISLSGIVVRNSILIIEFIQQNKEQYEGNTAEAIITAGRARLRPIILTTLTSIAALTPIIFMGDVLFKPLAVSIVAGLIFSTVLTLLLLPAFYMTMEKFRAKQIK